MVKDCPSPSDGRTNSAANFTYLASATLCESPRSERIIIDSGTTSHMTNNKDWLTNCKALIPPKIVVLGDGHKLFAHGIGTLAVTLHLDDTMKCTADMRNCIFVPDLSCPLFSIRSATADGTKSLTFGRNGVRITDSTNREITKGSLTDSVYTLNCTVRAPSGSPQCSGNLPHDRAEEESNAASKTNACLVPGVSANLCHRRVGHMGEQNVNKSVNVDLVKDMPISKQEMTFCEPCAEGKARQQPNPKQCYTRSANILDLIHSDVCGPLKAQSFGGKGYFVTCTDDCSRFVWVQFIRDKSELSRKFRELVKELEKGTGRKVKALRSDRGGEYLSGEFQQYTKRR